MKMGNIWKAGKIFGFKILLYVQIGVCIFIFIFFYVCVWPQRGVFVVSIFLRSWPQLCSSSLCLTADLADKICFCFRNCGSNTKQCCFICENLSAVTITQHEGTLSESLTLSSSFIQHRCSPVQYVKWMAGCVPWALVHRHTHTHKQTAAEDLCLLISGSSLASSLSGQWNAKVSLCHSQLAHTAHHDI